MRQVMVFFSSCASVKYHAELLNYVDLPVADIHGKQKQARRTTTFTTFCSATSGAPPLHAALPCLSSPSVLLPAFCILCRWVQTWLAAIDALLLPFIWPALQNCSQAMPVHD